MSRRGRYTLDSRVRGCGEFKANCRQLEKLEFEDEVTYRYHPDKLSSRKMADMKVIRVLR